VILDLQLSPAQCTWSEYIDAVLAAEAAGFGTVWVLDHLSGVSFDGPTMLECFTLLGALATATSTLRLGALVANVANRSAGLLAVAASTVQTVSEGRLHLGLGAGTSPRSSFAREQLALGITPASTIAERHQRVVDALDLFDSMWSTDRDAEHWKGFPLPEHRPPVVLGVNSVRLAVIAGQRTNGINIRAASDKRSAVLAAAQAARPDDHRPWTTSVWARWDEDLLDPTHPLRVELASEGVDRLILSWFPPPDAKRIAAAAWANRPRA